MYRKAKFLCKFLLQTGPLVASVMSTFIPLIIVERIIFNQEKGKKLLQVNVQSTRNRFNTFSLCNGDIYVFSTSCGTGFDDNRTKKKK